MSNIFENGYIAGIENEIPDTMEYLNIPSSNGQMEVRVLTESKQRSDIRNKVEIKRVVDKKTGKKTLVKQTRNYKNGIVVKEVTENRLENNKFTKNYDKNGHPLLFVQELMNGSTKGLSHTVAYQFNKGDLVKKTDVWPNGQELIRHYDSTRNESGEWRSIMRTPLDSGAIKIEVKHHKNNRIEGLEYSYTTDGEMEEVTYHPRSDLDEKENEKLDQRIQRSVRIRRYFDKNVTSLFSDVSKEDQVAARAERLEKKHYGMSLNLG